MVNTDKVDKGLWSSSPEARKRVCEYKFECNSVM